MPLVKASGDVGPVRRVPRVDGRGRRLWRARLCGDERHDESRDIDGLRWWEVQIGRTDDR